MLNSTDRKRMNEIVCNMIVANMKAGLDHEKAKNAAFNRLERDYPEVLVAWLNRDKKETETKIEKFKTGETYTAHSICDYDIVWSFEILRRTAKSVWVEVDNKIVRRAIDIFQNTETFSPFGKYSMSATVHADK